LSNLSKNYNISTRENDYDIFVCYNEITGKDFATMIHRALTQRGYKVFVAHVERDYISGNFRDVIDNVIDKCHTFILLNTLDTLSRPEVIREVQRAFPSGDITKHVFWIFRENEQDVPRSTIEFTEKTQINLSDHNQSDFSTDAHLARSVLRRCNKKGIEAQTPQLSPYKGTKEKKEERRFETSHLSFIKQFAEKLTKKGYVVEVEKELGPIRADLLIQKNDELILCEFKRRAERISRSVFGQLLLQKTELENIIPNRKVKLWLIALGNFNPNIVLMAKKYDITLMDDHNIENYLEEDSIRLSVDRSIVMHGGTLKISIRLDYIKDDSVLLKIINSQGKIVHLEKIIVEDRDITKIILTKGPDWITPGEEYLIKAEYGGKTAEEKIWRSDFGATIELDQKVYTWTDKVFITIVAPDYNFDPDIIDTVMVTVSTRHHKLANYKLVETGPDTGIFTGEVILTGFNHDAIGNGTGIPLCKTGGTGPTDGFIEAEDDDGLTVSFEFAKEETVVGSALIRWNIGEIKWLEANYPTAGQGVVRVVDPDMNLNPEAIDSFEIDVWSDSDAVGIRVEVTETNEATGIFEGIIYFTTKEKSSGNRLRVAEGDTVTAEYKDRTLPSPYRQTDQLQMTATAFIGKITSPLERVSIRNPILIDENNNNVDKVRLNQILRIGANLSNNQNRDQPFAFIMQIQDSEGITIHKESIKGTLSAWQSLKPTIPWKPTLAGTYNIQTFVWESEDNPDALSPPLQFKIEVK